MTILGFIARILAGATRYSIALAAALMLSAILYQVVTRYVLGAASSWSEEFAVLMFSWSVLAGLALGVHEGFHVRLTLLTDTLPLAGRIAAERVLDFITAALGVFLAWSAQAVDWLALRSQPALRIGLLAAVMAGCALIYFGLLRVLGLNLRALIGR